MMTLIWSVVKVLKAKRAAVVKMMERHREHREAFIYSFDLMLMTCDNNSDTSVLSSAESYLMSRSNTVERNVVSWLQGHNNDEDDEPPSNEALVDTLLLRSNDVRKTETEIIKTKEIEIPLMQNVQRGRFCTCDHAMRGCDDKDSSCCCSRGHRMIVRT